MILGLESTGNATGSAGAAFTLRKNAPQHKHKAMLGLKSHWWKEPPNAAKRRAAAELQQ